MSYSERVYFLDKGNESYDITDSLSSIFVQ